MFQHSTNKRSQRTALPCDRIQRFHHSLHLMHNAELCIRAQREQEGFSIRMKPYGACLAKRMDLVYSDGILSSELYDGLMRGCREAGRFAEKLNNLISVFCTESQLAANYGGNKALTVGLSCSPLAPVSAATCQGRLSTTQEPHWTRQANYRRRNNEGENKQAASSLKMFSSSTDPEVFFVVRPTNGCIKSTSCWAAAAAEEVFSSTPSKSCAFKALLNKTRKYIM